MFLPHLYTGSGSDQKSTGFDRLRLRNIAYIVAEEGPGHQQAGRDDDEERPAGNIIHKYSS